MWKYEGAERYWVSDEEAADLTPEQVRQLLRAATPGRWNAWEDPDGFSFINGPDKSATRPLAELRAWNPNAEADAALMAAAPQLAALYLAAIAEPAGL